MVRRYSFAFVLVVCFVVMIPMISMAKVASGLTPETKARYMTFVNRVDQFYKAGQLASGSSMTLLVGHQAGVSVEIETNAEEMAKVIAESGCQFDMTLPSELGEGQGGQEFSFGFQIFGDTCPVRMTLGSIIGQQMKDEVSGRIYTRNILTMSALDKSIEEESHLRHVGFDFGFDIQVEKEGEGARMNGTFTGGGEAYSLEEGKVQNLMSGHIRAKEGEGDDAFADMEEINTTIFADGTQVVLKKVMKADKTGQDAYCLLNDERITEDECVDVIEKLRLPKIEENEALR